MALRRRTQPASRRIDNDDQLLPCRCNCKMEPVALDQDIRNSDSGTVNILSLKSELFEHLTLRTGYLFKDISILANDGFDGVNVEKWKVHPEAGITRSFDNKGTGQCLEGHRRVGIA